MKLYIGIDWSQSKHDICFVNTKGVIQSQLVIPHSQTGFWEFEQRRKRLGVPAEDCLVGLETSHSILVDFLWDRGYANLFVLPPTLVKGSRTRMRSSAAKDDPGDAYLIADILRTDQGRLQAWQPDSGLTRQLRTKVRFISFLTRDIVRMTNRQRAVLLRYYPVAAELFSSLSTLISQHFILAYPTPRAAAALDLDSFRKFARQYGYTHKSIPHFPIEKFNIHNLPRVLQSGKHSPIGKHILIIIYPSTELYHSLFSSNEKRRAL